MATIARNHTRRIQAVKDAAKFCEVYDRNSGEMKPAEIDSAFRDLEDFRKARLTEDTPGEKWTVNVHPNCWYTLTVEDPDILRARQLAEREEREKRERARREREEAARLAAAGAGEETGDQAAGEGGGCWCEAEPCPMPAQHASAKAACEAMEANQRARWIASVPGFDASTRAALEAIINRHRKAGMTGPASSASSASARALVARTVKAMRVQGKTHPEIRAHFTAVLSEAREAGDLGRIAAAETSLAVHAGMLADMARLSAGAGAGAAKVEKEAPVAALAAAPVGVEEKQDQDQEEAAPVSAQGGGFRPAAWWEKPENAVHQVPPAEGAAALELPPHEEGYTPEAGAKPYPIRRVRAALEAAGIPVGNTDGEFTVFVDGKDDQSAHMRLMHFRGKGAKPSKGAGRDRWERRRAEILIALVDAGMEDVELSNAGLWVRVPRPKGAATVVQLGEKDYGENFDAPYIDQPVSFPQYPQITGWVMRRKWGQGYIGPMSPWMHHTGTGEVVGAGARDEQRAASALAAHYGLMVPVRVWHG
ncbi:hypothetical protein [Streptomyces violaceusniger]|uniref:Uncharacterized protein n=1 Tax=Streptomyces violaceusniger (strain Tu 4113) TaxID=653045 RepID=G2PHR1_STRV4|nr:hypothetical protein [Streptomyces violaceusniger]AEM88862.1 hypothetical protein Strvi_0086 [Streptomyces violaceusniger Tu 4113]